MKSRVCWKAPLGNPRSAPHHPHGEWLFASDLLPSCGFCSWFIDPVIYSQESSLLLLVLITCFLLLVCVFGLVEESGLCVFGLVEESSIMCVRFGRGKLPRITEACGNRRFRLSGRFEDLGEPRVQNGPPGPPGAILAPGKIYSTRRGGADDGGMAGVEGCRIKTPLSRRVVQVRPGQLDLLQLAENFCDGSCGR